MEPHSSTPSGVAGKLDRAVALRHDPATGRVPTVVAAGRGEVARRLVEIAAEHGVPVREDKDLAALLALVDLGDEIPVELYQAVAEVIAFVYRVGAEADAGAPRRP